jgi:hypothetical protein
MDPIHVLAENIINLMEFHGILSNAALAKAAKIDASTVGRMINKKHASQIDRVQAVARVFELDAWQLLIPNLDPSNPPVAQLTAVERDLYDRLRTAAEAFSIKK